MTGHETNHAPTTGARVYALLRTAFALLILATLAYQLHLSVTRYHTGATTFFSFFTVLSNILLAAAFLTASLHSLTARESTYGLERLRGAAVVYMMTTGAVYALLLAPHGHPQGGATESWINLILHRIAPVVAFADWLVAPPSIRLHATTWLSWLLFPLVFLAYTLIRGLLVDWYPYPFLNPSHGGYTNVAIYSVVIALGMLALSLLVGWLGSTLGKKARGG